MGQLKDVSDAVPLNIRVYGKKGYITKRFSL